MGRVQDQVAVVTGAAHGLGRAITLRLAEEGPAARPMTAPRAGPMLRALNATVEYSPERMTPMRRLGPPGEIASVVPFLVSEESSYITGVTLQATGGR